MLIEECFYYNQHFVAMMNIINLAKKQNIKGKFERHHIIPKCFYKVKGLEIDNSESNLVNLTYEQHKKVHQLAVLCAKEIVLVPLRMAALFMETYAAKTRLGGHHTVETRAKMSASHKGENNSSKRPEVRAKLSAAQKGKKHTEETRAKISAHTKGKKHGPMSAETRAKMSTSQKISQNRPEMKAKKSAARKGRHWHLENGIRVWTD